NREVKPCSADGTGVTPGRVGRRHIIQTLRYIPEGLFAFLGNLEKKIGFESNIIISLLPPYRMGFTEFFWAILLKRDNNAKKLIYSASNDQLEFEN
ncbi:hypothetical protein, partial [Cognataquiflexum rubidum]|uniref:hypothetical protein n=1 Tax=Cognataquiflexum rubidum TaxID=2922273 RepID=UPI001F146097